MMIYQLHISMLREFPTLAMCWMRRAERETRTIVFALSVINILAEQEENTIFRKCILSPLLRLCWCRTAAFEREFERPTQVVVVTDETDDFSLSRGPPM